MPYSCYHTYAHQAQRAWKRNATIIVFSHAYDLEGRIHNGQVDYQLYNSWWALALEELIWLNYGLRQ